MATFIGLQSGHKYITANCDPTLSTETGAPGENDFNWNVTLELSTILQKYGFQVQVDDANANCPGDPGNSLSEDFSFYLAIHAEGEPQGGAISAPDPSVDASNTESKRICKAIEDVYFSDTGIEDNPKIIDNNMTFYYMWNVLTAKTPCGIIECGALGDPHDSVILADTRRVALGIAHGLCNAFGVLWVGDPVNPAPPQPQPDPCADTKKQLSDLQAQFDSYKSTHPDIVISTYTEGRTSSDMPITGKITNPTVSSTIIPEPKPLLIVFWNWLKSIFR